MGLTADTPAKASISLLLPLARRQPGGTASARILSLAPCAVERGREQSVHHRRLRPPPNSPEKNAVKNTIVSGKRKHSQTRHRISAMKPASSHSGLNAKPPATRKTTKIQPPSQ